MNMLPVLARAFGVDPVAFERQVEAHEEDDRRPAPSRGRRYQSGYDDGFKAGEWAGRGAAEASADALKAELREAREEVAELIELAESEANTDSPHPARDTLARIDATLPPEAQGRRGKP
jgi:hypothetical protein